MTHTKLPWRLSPDYSNRVVTENGQRILQCTFPDDAPDEGAANAAFVVQACNAYYPMLQVLTWISNKYSEHKTVIELARDAWEMATAASTAVSDAKVKP